VQHTDGAIVAGVLPADTTRSSSHRPPDAFGAGRLTLPKAWTQAKRGRGSARPETNALRTTARETQGACLPDFRTGRGRGSILLLRPRGYPVRSPGLGGALRARSPPRHATGKALSRLCNTVALSLAGHTPVRRKDLSDTGKGPSP
jgi:hypothetical protein